MNVCLFEDSSAAEKGKGLSSPQLTGFWEGCYVRVVAEVVIGILGGFVSDEMCSGRVYLAGSTVWGNGDAGKGWCEDYGVANV